MVRKFQLPNERNVLPLDKWPTNNLKNPESEREKKDHFLSCHDNTVKHDKVVGKDPIKMRIFWVYTLQQNVPIYIHTDLKSNFSSTVPQKLKVEFCKTFFLW